MQRLIALFILLLGCGETSRLKDVVPGDLAAAIPGYGYDSHSETFTSACVKGSGFVYTGAPTSSLSFDRSLTYEQLKNLLDVKVSGKLLIEGLDVKAAARFLSEAASSDLSTSLVFANSIRGRYILLTDPTLTPAALDVADTLDADKVRAQCGDQFVEQVELGAELFVNMRFDFASRDVKSDFEAEINLNFVNLFEVSGAAKVAMERFKNNVGVTITAFQKGGNVTRLSKIFLDATGQASAVMRCGIDNIEKCTQVMENVVRYASGDFDGSFPSQLQNLSYDLNNPTGAAFLNYQTKSYYTAGLRRLYPEPGPVLAREIGEARNRLVLQYEGQARDRRRAQSLLTLRLSAADRERLTALDALLRKNIEGLTGTAQVCYETPARCVAAEKVLQLQSYDPTQLVKNLGFYDYCILSRSYPSVVPTLNALKGFIGGTDQTPCEDLEADLQNEHGIDLSNRGLSDLRPLMGLDGLRQLRLDGNNVRNLKPLAGLKQLQELSARNNQIGNIDALAGLSNLRVLDLAYNRVDDIQALAALKNLQSLKIHQNAIRDFSPISGRSFDLLYTSLDQICAVERDYALQQGWISPQQHQAYTRVNWGPLYVVPGKRESGLDHFMACEPIARGF